MGLLDEFFTAPAGGGSLDQIARQVGGSPDQVREAMRHLTPAVTRGIQRQANSQDGLGALLEMLQSGGHQQHLGNPADYGQASTINAGNDVLGQIFGSKDVSRQVAGRISEQSGLAPDLLKKLLPIVASIVMGSLAKNAMGGSQAQAGGQGGLGDILGSVLGGQQAVPGAGSMGGGGLGGLGDVLGSVLGGGAPQQQAAGGAPGGGIGGMLTSMLDADGDGSAFD
ncbi:MAG TPA: DUF937 domain-containing protein, partial [Dongiaceae bacterium]